MLILRKTTFFVLTLAVFLLLSISSIRADTVEFEGLIQPYEVVQIGAPTDGVVSKVAVDRSSLVKQGQELVELESSVERAELEKARKMATFNGEIKLQQAKLEFSKRVHDRLKQLSVISTHEKDEAATEIALTGYRLEKALENRTLAEFELNKARSLLAQRSIKSPISGVVVERYVSPGEYVSNQPLLRVAQIDPLRVEVIVPSQLFGQIIPGMTATIVPELSEYGEQNATVTIADKVIDSASNTFGVRLELPNPGQKMPSGLKCLVRFEIDKIADDAKKATSVIGPDQTQNMSHLTAYE
jgi:RND family efflux transporter MFP subunit